MDKCMKICSTRFIIRETQIKTLTKTVLIPVEAIPDAGEGAEQQNPYQLLTGMQKCSTF